MWRLLRFARNDNEQELVGTILAQGKVFQSERHRKVLFSVIYSEFTGNGQIHRGTHRGHSDFARLAPLCAFCVSRLRVAGKS